jgi:hypothetical protein
MLVNLLSKTALPIPDRNTREVISKNTDNFKDCTAQYIEQFDNWIKSSKLHNLKGLDEYQNIKFSYGTVQCFDHFYIKHNKRRFRFFHGDFVYHSVISRNSLSHCFLGTEEIGNNDAVLISVPFSDTGSQHSKLIDILEECEKKNVPVLLDMAYFGISKGINLNLHYSCIDSVCFSLSKCYDGAQHIRCGIRYQRKNSDDGIDLQTDVKMLPFGFMQKGIALMNLYGPDHLWTTHQNKYYEVCSQFNLKTTDTIIFGLGGPEYLSYGRSNDVNRVCISKALANDIQIS